MCAIDPRCLFRLRILFGEAGFMPRALVKQAALTQLLEKFVRRD